MPVQNCCCSESPSPCYRQARKCSDGTLADGSMTCDDAITIGTGSWKLADGTCVYFDFTDPTYTSPPATLYSAASVTTFPDCSTCGGPPPSGCSACGSCCYDYLNLICIATCVLSRPVTATDFSLSNFTGGLTDPIVRASPYFLPQLIALLNTLCLNYTRVLDYTVAPEPTFRYNYATTTPPIYQHQTDVARICETNVWRVNNVSNFNDNIPGGDGHTYSYLSAGQSVIDGTTDAGTCCGDTFIVAGATTFSGNAADETAGGSFDWSIGVSFTFTFAITNNKCCSTGDVMHPCATTPVDNCPANEPCSDFGI